MVAVAEKPSQGIPAVTGAVRRRSCLHRLSLYPHAHQPAGIQPFGSQHVPGAVMQHARVGMKSMPAASAAMVTISATVSTLIGPPRSNGPVHDFPELPQAGDLIAVEGALCVLRSFDLRDVLNEAGANREYRRRQHSPD
jgi:hypothetical protein